jgi:hypothetical protein
MSNNFARQLANPSAAAKQSGWKQWAGRKRFSAKTLGLAIIAFSGTGLLSRAHAQMGQSAMAPAGGVVNRAVQGFQNLNENGPGWFYYGLNAADRGLGYRGSYMTLGGFAPMAEDDLGGLWSADLRSHLSNYGGFFSNVGAVRKQFIGGTLLGVGVYWDYDGDQNQYAATPIGGTSYIFPGGQSYNQVGVSGEWLTDWGNLRSNGYIPVGSTAQLIGPFLQNTILCENGVNAALGGADLEVGAYIPGLSDWAGMISVGGYAYGNARYTFPDGSAAVPWFGGVYTRLDMTLIQNWDFSLQYNNDSFFDSTGFARLTYRMGGSRRRNVPDQMEQPMMRNEHIVRARLTPEVAINPETGAPWRVIHVDNSAAPGGNGSSETPFTAIGAAAAAATTAYDVVYLHAGNSATPQYVTPAGGFDFNAPNQYLVGQGSPLVLPTVSCGNRAFFSAPGASAYPIITNPIGPAIVIDQPGATVSHVQIVGSQVGVSDGTGLAAPGIATVTDVVIAGNLGAAQNGIVIANSTGTFNFDNTRLSNLTGDGLRVSAANGNVNLANSSLTGINGTAIRNSGAGAVVTASNVQIETTNGAVNASGANSSVVLTNASIRDTTGNAVVASGNAASITVNASRILQTQGSALATTAAGVNSRISATNTTIRTTANPAIRLDGAGSQIGIARTSVSEVTGVGVLLAGANTQFFMTDASSLTGVTLDGISLTDPTAFASISGRSVIGNIGGDGIKTVAASIQFANSTIQSVGGSGINATDVSGNKVVWVQGGTIADAQNNGIRAVNSNLRVEQLDPTNPRSPGTTISNAGLNGILVRADKSNANPYRAYVDSATISGVTTGIGVFANADLANPPPAPVPTIDFTGNRNQITAAASGISISGFFDGTTPAGVGQQLSQVHASMTDNSITSGGSSAGILLTVAGDPTTFAGTPPYTAGNGVIPIVIAAADATDLQGLNNGATVLVTPSNSRVVFNPALVPQLPPPPPTPP